MADQCYADEVNSSTNFSLYKYETLDFHIAHVSRYEIDIGDVHIDIVSPYKLRGLLNCSVMYIKLCFNHVSVGFSE